MAAQVVSIKTYSISFLALMALLALTVAANFLDLGSLNVAAAMAISLAKAALIGLFFMEVRYSKPMVWLFAAAGFMWLLILVGLTLNDYHSRPWSHQYWKDNGARPLHMTFPK